MVNVIAAHHKWYADMPKRLAGRTGHEFVYISAAADLTVERLVEIGPRFVFFPHWSHRIPSKIFSAFECVIFHMTDVPFGRGGTPLQNLLARGIYETKISALRCEAEMDAGPVYLKKPLSLYGTAEEIYIRAARQIEDMIAELVLAEPQPQPQSGTPVCFARRKPEDGSLETAADLVQVYDFIRMLDAEGYPKAFLTTSKFRLEFSRASLRSDRVVADVTITRRDNET